MKITAAVVKEKGAPFVLEEAELDQPQPQEVLVRIVATGICHTDMVIRNQQMAAPLPMVLGHEGAGVVEAIGIEVFGTKIQQLPVDSWLDRFGAWLAQQGFPIAAARP